MSMSAQTNTYRLWQRWAEHPARRRYEQGRLDRWIYWLTHLRTVPFEHILIQTNYKCTRTCPFCYYGMKGVKENDTLMPEELFKKIIGELGAMNYSGRISLFEMNEPLTDPRLADFIRYAKQQAPRSWQFIVSNGDLLTGEKAIELFRAGLDYLQVSAYSKNVYQKCKMLAKAIPHPWGERLILRPYYVQNFAMDNRGGHLPGFGPEIFDGQPCDRINHVLYIKPDGTAVSCFGDYFNNNVVGDARVQSVDGIWRGEAFARLRQRLNRGDRTCSDICRQCNVGVPGRFATREGLDRMLMEQHAPKGIIVGASASARIFLPALQRHSQIRCLVTRQAEPGEGFSQLQRVDRLDEALADPEVDYVFVANTNAEHFETVKKALLADKHVLVEKPMAGRVEELEELARVAAERHLVLGGIFQWRFLRCARAAQEWLNQGIFGDLLFVNARVLWKRDPEYFVHGRGSRAVDGGGVLMKQAIHALDLVLYLAGEPLAVQAMGARDVGGRDVEDTAVMAFRFKRSLGTLTATVQNSRDETAQIEIIGTRGRVVFDAKDEIRTWELEAKKPDLEKKADLCEEQIVNYMNALHDPNVLVVTPAECRRSLSVLQQVYEAAEFHAPARYSGKKES